MSADTEARPEHAIEVDVNGESTILADACTVAELLTSLDVGGG